MIFTHLDRSNQILRAPVICLTCNVLYVYKSASNIIVPLTFARAWSLVIIMGSNLFNSIDFTPLIGHG